MNKYIQKGKITELHIKDKIILIDTDEVERLLFYSWVLRPDGYCEAFNKTRLTKGNKHLLLHRHILGLDYADTRKYIVDHINCDKYDNRKANLRIVNLLENGWNKLYSQTGNKNLGVSKCYTTGKWRVRFQKDKKDYWIGRFKTEEEAIEVAKVERQKLFNLI